MGSSGTGSFGNYQPSEKASCDETVDTDLEEIALAEYFAERGTVPPVGTSVRLHDAVVKGRLIVETVKKPQTLGLLPTSFQHLALCLKKGYSYTGEVTASGGKKIPVITVSLVSQKS
jgi:hypothetical protein